jgi:hypothetical protein
MEPTIEDAVTEWNDTLRRAHLAERVTMEWVPRSVGPSFVGLTVVETVRRDELGNISAFATVLTAVGRHADGSTPLRIMLRDGGVIPFDAVLQQVATLPDRMDVELDRYWTGDSAEWLALLSRVKGVLGFHTRISHGDAVSAPVPWANAYPDHVAVARLELWFLGTPDPNLSGLATALRRGTRGLDVLILGFRDVPDVYAQAS